MAFSIPNPSHSHVVVPIPIPEIYALWNPFPFPYYSRKLIPIPSHSHSREMTYEWKHFKRDNVCNVFRVHRLRVTETRRTEYKYTDISDYWL